jgi:mono/diheme cytochrome c family protein
MRAKEIISALRPTRLLLAACLGFVIALALLQAGSVWRQWKQYLQGSAILAQSGPVAQTTTLAWKQPVLPAQYIQGTCGACHREDLPQTPRLNHGRQLMVRFNCVGCHRLQDIDRPVMLGPDLTNVGTKVSREWIYKWLKEPRTITDADGNVTVDGVTTEPRMPKFPLNEQELRALSAYLSIQRANPVVPYKINLRVVAAVGRKGSVADAGHVVFNQRFCVTCHALSVVRAGQSQLIGGDVGPELTKVGSKVKPEWLVAWLRDPAKYLEHTRMTHYQWSDQELYEVTQFILTKLTDPALLSDVPKLSTPTDDEVQLGRQLFQKKGCAQCHVLHGVEPEKNFGSDLSAFGMAAAGREVVTMRLSRNEPPPFHFVKGNVSQLDIKVSRVPRFMIAYVQAKLTNPTSVTPAARMPQFYMSQGDLDDVTTALLGMNGTPADGKNKLIIPRTHPEFHPDGQFAKLYERYRCAVCHSFNGYGGTLAPDLSFEGSRSKHEWLIQFLKSPQTLRPTKTVRMPYLNMPDRDASTIADYLSTEMQKPSVNPKAVDEKEFTSDMASRGKQLYEVKYQCQACHTIGSSGGYVGPSLNIAGNWLTPAWIEAWLRNPQELVPGTIEPRQNFTEEEVKDLTAYLLTLQQSAKTENTTSVAVAGGHP